MKTFNVILAVDINYGISKNGEIPWKSKTDIQFFKNMTEKTSLPGKQNIVIMGRKTFESLPNNYLPNRTNYVITRNKHLKCDNISTFDSFNKATSTALDSNNNVWVIGGAEIYDQSFRHKNIGNIYLTQFNKDFNCDLHVKLPNSKLITMNTIIDNDVEVEVSFIKFRSY